jgi:hypothetical protein
MVLPELPRWVNDAAQLGDVAYLIDKFLDKRYLYFYKGPDDDPYSKIIDEQFFDYYIKEIDKLKVEETKMEKRCENCKHFAFVSGLSYCKHEAQAGTWVPKFTCCDKHTPKQKLTGPFDNLKFFIKDQGTGELEVKYICEDCGRVMEAPFHWQFRVPFGANKDPEKRPGYYYWCEECWEKENKK